MPTTPLVTLLHVSDLHFGNLDLIGGSSILEPEVPAWWRWHRSFDGFMGHHFRAVAQLADFFRNLRKVNPDLKLIVTGDVTAYGTPAQFDLAREYLTNAADMGGAMPLGLGVQDAVQRTIPGNHDHWPGTGAICGAPSAGFGTFFRATPFVETLPLVGNRKLGIIGINTDAEVHPHRFQRRAARGSFVSQLTKADRELLEQPAHDLRVLLLHHSPAHTGFILGIDRSSREALLAFARRRGIRILLSGHAHVPLSEELGTDGRRLLELRCGTTLQRDEIPYDWIAKGVKEERLVPNTLLLHRLVEDGGGLAWEMTVHQRTEQGFIAQPEHPASGTWQL